MLQRYRNIVCHYKKSMKNFLFAAFACVGLVACNKSGSSTLTGRWKVISDSSITSGATVSYNIYNEMIMIILILKQMEC